MSSQIYQQYEKYPRPEALGWVLKPHESIEVEEDYQRLQSLQGKLFSDSNHKIELLQSNSDPLKSNVPLSYSFTNADEMRQHLMENPNNGVRHMFIEADNSRAPLNCTASMLKCILTYQQVPPSFLKAVYAFGDIEGEPSDTGVAGFGHDSGFHHGYPRGSQYATDHANERRLWYLVRSVERAQESETAAGRSWTIRQAAVYQSFNVFTGHSFFLIIQASGLFRKQIHQKAGWLLTNPSMGKSREKGLTVLDALEAGLSTHLVCLSWCCRYWGEFIDNLRSLLRPIFDRASTARVDGDLEGLALDSEFGRQRVAHGSALRQFHFRDLQSLFILQGRVTEAMWVAAEVQNVIKSLQACYGRIAQDTPKPNDMTRVIAELFVDLSAFQEALESARGQLKVLDSKIQMGFELQQKGLDYRMWFEREPQKQRLQTRSKQDVPEGRRGPAPEERRGTDTKSKEMPQMSAGTRQGLR